MKAVSFLSNKEEEELEVDKEQGRRRGKMLSRDKMRFKGTGTCQGPQGRDSSLTTFTFSVFRVRDNLLWDEKHGKEKKRKKTGWREEMPVFNHSLKEDLRMGEKKYD